MTPEDIVPVQENTTALVPLPQALAIARRQHDEAKEKYQTSTGVVTACLGGIGGMAGGIGMVFLAIHPVTALIGGLVFLSGAVSMAVGVKHDQKLWKVQYAAEERVAAIKRVAAKEQTKTELYEAVPQGDTLAKGAPVAWMKDATTHEIPVPARPQAAAKPEAVPVPA